MLTIGIDLGTTATVVAQVKDGKPSVIALDSGKKTTPSVVFYGKNGREGEREVFSSKDFDEVIVGREALSKMDYDHTIISVKRSMGSNKKFLREKSPEMISADILSFVKERTERKIGAKIDAAIITVPAHFSDAQRTATKHAASLAGIKVLRLINEPTAAAIAFGLEKNEDGIFAVYDFGGGTFDFSILRLSSGIFQVLATGGDNYLGGDDIDQEILEYNLSNCGLDFSHITESEKLIGRLLAKSMKEQCVDAGSIVKRKFVCGSGEYEFELSLELLEKFSKKYIERTFQIADQVFSDANLTYEKISKILLVGGMTKMSLVKKAVKERFKTEICDDIDPEEVVALGAAIHADAITNKSSNSFLIDVVPLTLGIETFGGGIDKIIYRNTPIPTIQTREYTTYADNQNGIKFHVVQGERALAKDCRSIADFELKNIPPMPKGKPRIIVKFAIDVNGLLTVNAYEKNTRIEQGIVVEPSSGLTEEAMISMLESAMKNAKRDSEVSVYISMKMAAERQISFWESIIDELPKKEQAEVSENLRILKDVINDEKASEKISEQINKIEKIVGLFLDEIISRRLSKSPIKINDVQNRIGE